MTHLETGQKLVTSNQTVINGGDYEEEEVVEVINELGQTCCYQAYFIVHGIVYDQRTE